MCGGVLVSLPGKIFVLKLQCGASLQYWLWLIPLGLNVLGSVTVQRDVQCCDPNWEK